MSGYSARQVAAMAAHVRACPLCGRGDADIQGGMNEGFPPEELDEFIRTAHDPAWLRISGADAGTAPPVPDTW